MIKEAAYNYQAGCGFYNYNNFDFSHLCPNSSSDSEYFINKKGLTFTNYVGKYLTGNELLFYPTLAQKMRELEVYPTLKRTFEVSNAVRGIDFWRYFYQTIEKSYAIFRGELQKASTIVNQLVDLYGKERKMPICDAIEIDPNTAHYRCPVKEVVISGVKWSFDNRNKEKRCIDYINLRLLLGLNADIFEFEDIEPGTPFIAIRIRNDWNHRGHVQWFNLDLLEHINDFSQARVYKADITKWKKIHLYK